MCPEPLVLNEPLFQRTQSRTEGHFPRRIMYIDGFLGSAVGRTLKETTA